MDGRSATLVSMLARFRQSARLDRFDLNISRWMYQRGHRLDRLALGTVFIWFGALKVAGFESATSIIAKTIYFGSPEAMTTLLGAWEIAIGVFLIWRPFIRVALLLLAVRLPGTFLALVLRPDVCWTDTPFVPTIQGQYLIKDLILFSAAMVIGGTVRDENAGEEAKH